MKKTKYRNYDPSDPEDLSDLTFYLLRTLNKKNKLPKGWALESLLGMGYIITQHLAKKYDSKIGITLEAYVFKYFPGRLFDYFQSNEQGKKPNKIKNKEGSYVRPENETRFKYKTLTNSEEIVFGKREAQSIVEYNSAKHLPKNKLVFSNLNQNQKDALYLLAKGFNQKQVSKALGISESAVSQIRRRSICKCRIESSSYTLEDNEYSVS
mgnify:CR=1 FL=1